FPYSIADHEATFEPSPLRLPSSITVEGKTHTIAAQNLTVLLPNSPPGVDPFGREVSDRRAKADESGTRLVIVYGE
ncbi:hypothetical protein Dimus_003801, partial [Dionaea muscipula]